ncbi:PREDICTED: CASP-like protein 4D1 [Lupinus angustifolius]|uniref:CASP-like protein 4D1 n=1 Tax=Lupinus angustifolius TaxID=3871 RepID=UPI00092ED42A|nr:PREDICTED: CASP-like protein 4D1 [Lupinus angustifolius]
MDSTPSSSTISKSVVLVLRVLTFVFLLIALILIAIDKGTEDTTNGPIEVKFNDIHAYRYMLSTIVIGFAYNLLQLGLSIFNVVSGNRVISGDGAYFFDFFGDKIISYLILSGSASGFGVSNDLHSFFKAQELPFNSFFAKANASATLLLIAFLFTSIASIFTSLALPKKT